MRHFLKYILLVSVLFVPAIAQSSERILNYHSDITVNTDSSLDVVETIKVRAEGKDIKRGIYRDFPTIYREDNGQNYQVEFSLLDVKRDGDVDGYHTENLSNGIRVYIGRQNVFLPTGEYTYTIRYKTTGQLGYFTDYDEIYWNVTGNGWIFPIDRASATIHLPSGISSDQVNTTGFTGPQGSQEQAFSSQKNADGTITFTATRSLGSYEGLTIAVSFPKGYVTEISRETFYVAASLYHAPPPKRDYLLFIFVAVVLLYYLFVWWKVGMDPDKGTIIPLYYPPKDFAPDMVRYLSRMGYDNKAFTAEVIALAVKGAIKIEDDRNKIGPLSLGGDYILHREKPKVNLTLNEAFFLGNLLPESKTILKLKNSNHEHIQRAITNHKGRLKRTVNKIYFLSNIAYYIGGFLLSLLGLMMLVPLLESGSLSPIYYILTFFLVMVLNGMFYKLLKAPTVSGRSALDKIEGFKMFLSATEKETLKWLDSPQKTPQLYEDYLPYAIALDVEDKWSRQFTAILAAAVAAGYAPDWYSSQYPFRSDRFADDFGGHFSHAISSSAQAPGSSSGSGGGGSSGGGGGGGGGGGW